MEFESPDLKHLIPHNVNLVRRKIASVTVFRIVVVAFTAFGIIFLAVTCFLRTKSHLHGTANRRKLAGFRVGEAQSENEAEAGDDQCQEGGRERKRGDDSQPLQDTSDTGEGESPRSAPPAGSAYTVTSLKKHKNTEHTEEAGSSSASRRSLGSFRRFVASIRRASGGQPRRETQEGEGSVVDQSAASPETLISPKKHRNKRKHTSSSRPSISVLDQLQILGTALSVEVLKGKTALQHKTAPDPSSIWLLSKLERAMSGLLTGAEEARLQVSGQLTGEQLGTYLRGIPTAMTAIWEARKLASSQGVASRGSGSSEQPTDRFPAVLVNTIRAASKLGNAMNQYRKHPSEARFNELLAAYHEGQQPFAEGEALSALLTAPVHKAGRDLLNALLNELAEFSETASNLIVVAFKYLEAPEVGTWAAAASQERVHEKEGTAKSKTLAKSLKKKMKKLKKKLKSAARNVEKVSLSEAQLELSGLVAEASGVATAASRLVAIGGLDSKRVMQLERALSEMLGELNNYFERST